MTVAVYSAARVRSGRLRWVTRAGLAVNGGLHLLVAAVAVRVALGDPGRADQAGALQAVAAQPFGRLLVWLVVVGFTAVVLWRTREALWGFRYVRDRNRRTAKRLFSALQAAVFAGLATLALRVASGAGAGSGGVGPTAAVLALPAGRQLVAAVGVAVVVMGYRGWRLAFLEDLDLDRAGPRGRRLARRTGRTGALAKAAAFVVIGLLVVQAGIAHRPERAEGLDVALKAVAAQPYGPVALVAVAAGLASFGVFCFCDARYHRV